MNTYGIGLVSDRTIKQVTIIKSGASVGKTSSNHRF